jgi:hypothetical protein
MPWVIQGFVTSELAYMLTYDLAIPDNLDETGRRSHNRRLACSFAVHAIMVAIEPDQAGTRDPALVLSIPVKWHLHRDEMTLFLSETLTDSASFLFRVPTLCTDLQALVMKPCIEFFKAFKSWAGRKQPATHILYLLLNLPFLPASRWSAGNWLNKIVTAHLDKPFIEDSLLATQYLVHRSRQIVIDPTPANPAKKRKCAVMAIKDHLLALTGISHNKKLPAVAEPKMSNIYLLDKATQNSPFITPVELVCIPWRKAQRNKGALWDGTFVCPPALRVALNTVITSLIAFFLEEIE